jgi:hypothetical protein
LEQCKRVYENLVNQYKSLARKIDERIHWSELDITANHLSAEHHKLNYRLQELEDEEEKRDREERVRVAKRDKEKRAREIKQDNEKREEERAREANAKQDREERSRVEREEEAERVIRQKIEGGKEITVYVNTRAIDRKLGPIKLDVNSRDSILRVKLMIESVVGLTTHEMIISNARDEEMSDEKSLAMCNVKMGSFVIIKRRS